MPLVGESEAVGDATDLLVGRAKSAVLIDPDHVQDALAGRLSPGLALFIESPSTTSLPSNLMAPSERALSGCCPKIRRNLDSV